jgi:hypothetical protein
MTEQPKWTPGPWAVFIDDSGDKWTGWPISIDAVTDPDKTVVRTGGQWPYDWGTATSQREAVANAHLIAAAPDLYAALAYTLATIRRKGLDHWWLEDALDADDIAAVLAKARGETRG